MMQGIDRGRTYAGVFLTTLAVLMLELGLTRLFSATMFYHFAFLAISLALFGSAASGLVVYFLQQRLAPERTGTWLTAAGVLFALGVLLALHVVLANPLTVDASADNGRSLLAIYLATSVPFFFAGCAVTLAITRLAGDVSRLYLFDLAGAATGCLTLIPAMNVLGAVDTLLLVAVVGAAAATVFASTSTGGRAARGTAVLVTVFLAGLLGYNRVSRAIDVRVAKGQEETNILFSKWNSFSRVTVVAGAGGPLILIDADAAARIVRPEEFSRGAPAPNNVRTLAYRLKQAPDALVIGAGGGRDVAAALACGARSVVAVEVNPIIARDIMSREPFKSLSGAVFFQPGVRLVVDEGRSFIRGSRRRYDIIQAVMVDTWAATAAGAFALTENNLYTVEAFGDYADHLTDDGILSVTRWYYEPPDQPLRLVSLARAMMAERGTARPERHLVMMRQRVTGVRGPATLLLKRSEFTDAEVRKLEGLAPAQNFEVLYTPLTRPDNLFTRLASAPDPARAWDAHETNLAPVRDNSPFFFNSLRVSNLRAAFQGEDEWRKTNLGTFVLFLLLAISLAFVAAFIFGPLVLVHGRRMVADRGRTLSYLGYFGCLGAGFIVVEVALAQKFILFLGRPVYALAVVLFSLLLFSSLGSALTARFPVSGLRQALVRVLAGLAALVVVYVALLSPVFYAAVHLPLPLRIAIAVGLIAPLGVLMGMPMPTGIRVLAGGAPELVPWAWGVNGATSVLGSVAALVIAILSGFNQALLVAAGLYLLAGAFLRLTDRARRGSAHPEVSVHQSGTPSGA